MEEETSLKPAQVLRRTLSVQGLASTPTTISRNKLPTTHAIRNIGRGSCGSVWEEVGTQTAYKTSPHVTDLWADYHTTFLCSEVFRRWQGLLQGPFPSLTLPRVPRPTRFYMPSSNLWKTEMGLPHLAFAEHGCDILDAIQFDRIPPVPSQARRALIQQYFEPLFQQKAFADPENHDCLVRLYLGANDPSPGQPRTSLRNFELYLDMANSLGLEIDHLAREMALSLATIHWEARVDGMDAEWVLGGSGEESPESEHRLTHLWVLDFDKTRKIEGNESCIPLLLGGVTANDPYLPNPLHSPEELYKSFAETYLEASEFIIRCTDPRPEVLALPARFLEAWEAWANERRKNEDATGFDLEGWVEVEDDEEDDLIDLESDYTDSESEAEEAEDDGVQLSD